MYVCRVLILKPICFCNIEQGKIVRLLFIADICPSLASECLEAVLEEVKASTWDITLYKKVYTELSNIYKEKGETFDVQMDTSWIDKASSLSKICIDKLENELQSAKASMVKETTRVGIRQLHSNISQE